MFKLVAGKGDKYRYLIFPILHNKQLKTRGSDHWTVIVLDMTNGDYMYYNSALPHHGSNDPYHEDAMEMVSYSCLML